MKKRILSALCAILMLGVFSTTVFAVEVPDFDRKGSIDITMSYQGEAVPGGTLTLYRVADVVEDDGSYYYAYTSAYADCEVPVDDASSARVAAALADIVSEKSLEGNTQTISTQGEVLFSDLEIGLYLLIQEEAAPGYNVVAPFLVSVPGGDSGGYVYDVDASPKLELVPEPTEPPTQPPTEPPTEPSMPPELPQTGQTRWPVPVLALSGLLLVVLGLVLRTSGRKKSYES